MVRPLIIDSFADEAVQMPSGLILPRAAAERRLSETRRPKAIDFFCGCGGFSLGVMQAGFEVVAGVENDAHAAVTYMTNLSRWGSLAIHFVTPEDRARLERVLQPKTKRGHPSGSSIERVALAGTGWIAGQPDSVIGVSHFFFGDVRKLTAERILSDIDMKRGELDLVFGGPPCQGYSVAGKRDVMDPRSSLVFDFARFIVGLNPKLMAMENVVGITTMLTPEGQPVLSEFARILEDGGFEGRDAFQRVLAQRTGAVGLMRGKPAKKPERKPASAARPSDAMPDLFAAE